MKKAVVVAVYSGSRAMLSSLCASGEAAQPTPIGALDNKIFDAASSIESCTSGVDANPNKSTHKFLDNSQCLYPPARLSLERFYLIIEYKPLCRERDEIRVISIEPSKSYSSGRGTENSWTPYTYFHPAYERGFPCVSAVRIAVAEDLVHCRLEHVSLQDTVDR